MFKIQPIDQWPIWVVEGLDELALCEEKSDNSGFFDGADGWVDNALEMAVRIINPTISRRRIPASGCFVLGAVTGHQKWLIEHVKELFPPEEVLDAMIENFNCWLKEALQMMTEPQQKVLLKEVRRNEQVAMRLEKAFDRACELKRSAIQSLLQRSVLAPGNEHIEFLEGYTKAMRRPAMPAPENMSPREKMVAYVLMNWSNVQSMKNRTVLRESLGALFNQPDVYNHDFVQGVCKDAGLDLKKGPGRQKNRIE